MGRCIDGVAIAIHRGAVGVTVRVTRIRVPHRGTGLRVAEMHLLKICPLLLGPDGGQQVDEEGQDVEGEDESDDPLEDGGDVFLAFEGGDAEDDGEGDFDEDEGQFHPEAGAEDAVLPEVDAEALVFGADEDGADDVAGDEEEEEAVVEFGVAERVEDGEEDQAGGAGYGEDDWWENSLATVGG